MLSADDAYRHLGQPCDTADERDGRLVLFRVYCPVQGIEDVVKIRICWLGDHLVMVEVETGSRRPEHGAIHVLVFEGCRYPVVLQRMKLEARADLPRVVVARYLTVDYRVMMSIKASLTLEDR